MINKKTAVFFADTYKNSVANALKSEFVKLPDSVGIIVSKAELKNTFASSLVDRVLPKDSNVRYALKNMAKPMSNLAITKGNNRVLSAIKIQKSMERRIKNVLVRYNPDVIFITDHSILSICIKAVNDLGRGTKVVVPLHDFTLDKRMVNNNVDLYFVDNFELKGALLALGVAEEKIEVSDLPIAEKFFTPIDYQTSAKKLNIDQSKKTVLISASYVGDNRFKKVIDALCDASLDANLIFACGKNRACLAYVRSKGFLAFNESIEMQHALNVADLVIMRPTAMLMQEAIAKEKTVYTIFPANRLEENNQNYLAVDKIKKFGDVPSLIASTKEFLQTEIEKDNDIVVKYTIEENDEQATYQRRVEKVTSYPIDKDSANNIISRVLEII